MLKFSNRNRLAKTSELQNIGSKVKEAIKDHHTDMPLRKMNGLHNKNN